MNPLATCQNLMLCEDRARLEAESDFACDVCMKAAKYLDEKVFESAKVDAKVAEKLKKVCEDIPDMKPAELVSCCLDRTLCFLVFSTSTVIAHAL
mmetsp:Transcript_29418/g.59309  ORF Transcript_29418/g.59309 Transcript_29418/m.59309 type:complete len:95 (+) Transcript_29418:384-668(+)